MQFHTFSMCLKISSGASSSVRKKKANNTGCSSSLFSCIRLMMSLSGNEAGAQAFSTWSDTKKTYAVDMKYEVILSPIFVPWILISAQMKKLFFRRTLTWTSTSFVLFYLSSRLNVNYKTLHSRNMYILENKKKKQYVCVIHLSFFLYSGEISVVLILHRCFGMNHTGSVGGSVFWLSWFRMKFLIWHLSLAKCGDLGGKQKRKEKNLASLRRCLFPWQCWSMCLCVWWPHECISPPHQPLLLPGCR